MPGPSSTLSMLEDRPSRPGADVHLAVFGKHPSAADHLEDLGMSSQSLVAFKQIFYVDAIGKNLGQGRWKEAMPGDGLPWAHWLLCAGPQGFLLARCVASSDSRQRRQYPLVLAAHILQPTWIEQAPRLDFLRESALAMQYEATREGLENVRAEAARKLHAWTLEERSSMGMRRVFAGDDESSPARTGVLRVLHALMHGGPRARARVPSGPSALETAVLWTGLLRGVLPRAPVVTATLSDERPESIELTAAIPDAEAVRGLFPAPGAVPARPTEESAPASPAVPSSSPGDPPTGVDAGPSEPATVIAPRTLTTEVPFQLETAFTETANRRIHEWVQGRPPDAWKEEKSSVFGRLTGFFRKHQNLK